MDSDHLEKGRPVSEPRLYPVRHDCHGRGSARKRFRIVFGTVALAWLVFTYGFRVFGRTYQAWVNWSIDNVGYPPPAHADVDQCVTGPSTNWTYHDDPPWAPDYPLGAEISFSLPLDSDALYLISRGALQHGQVNIEQSAQVTDEVDVRVRVAYHRTHALEHATVCQLERSDSEHGVGIFTPGRVSPYHGSKVRLEFEVTLTLPAGSEGPLSVKQLETRMPNYDQNVSDLEETVLFDSISLASVNGRLNVQSVTCETGQFSSVNGDIDGHFNARSSLDIQTLRGRITPTVNLVHRHCAAEDASSLAIHTINGRINAEVSLLSSGLVGGEFEVDVQSTHGEIELKFTDSPVNSVLRCRAESTVGCVQVELDSAFEGTYSLQTALGTKLVSQHDVEDPAGEGRHRVVTVKEARGRVEGELKWVDSEGGSSRNDGHVMLKALMPSLKLVV